MSPWDLNIRHLRAFAATVELGTLVAAAQAVHISQPALTQAIAGLEAALQLDLFVRQNDGMAPTDAARLLYARVVPALAQIGSHRATHVQLRAFWALARHGSYAEASQAMKLAPASLHRAVSDLEAAMERPLTIRLGRRLVLTDEGRAFARRVKLAHADLAAALCELQALSGHEPGRIAIGAMPLCRARILPAAIVAFQQSFPDCDVFVAEGSHAELAEPLRDGELDILIGALRDPPPGRDLVQEPLFIDRPVVVARPGHPLIATGKVRSLQALARHDWCLPQRGVPLRDLWEGWLNAEGIIPPPVRIEIGSIIAVRQILMHTDALALVSPDQVALELKAGWLSVVAPTPLTRTIGITRRAEWRPTALQRRFIQTLQDVAANSVNSL